MIAVFADQHQLKPLKPSVELYAMIGVRATILLFALITVITLSIRLPEPFSISLTWLYSTIALLFLFCLISAIWLQLFSANKPFIYLQFIVDIAMISGIIYISGGLISPFLFLYLPLVMAAAIILSRQGALIIAVLCTIAYSSFSLSMVAGKIVPANSGAELQLPTSGLTLQIIGLSSGMLLIAFLTSLLINRLKSSYRLIEQSRIDIRELNNQQKELINGIPSGVIATQLDGTIISVNKAAENLLKTLESDLIKHNILALIAEWDPSLSGSSLDDCAALSKSDLKIELRKADQIIHLHLFSKPIRDQGGLISGYVFIFQDITKQRSVEEQLEIHDRMARLLAQQNEPFNYNHLNHNEFVGESPIMHKLFKLIERVANSEATVLISGESGSGKELVARAIHKHSQRRSGAFIAVNCGAIPDNLIESELFGHKKGSFTGADSDHTGLFRRADGGTIFLDEIGELPLAMQAKLLRTIQERTVHPVGGDRDFPINVRIVAATNKNLRNEVNEGRFREDLFYRLNVINIQMPPLRERREDIPLLVNHLLRKLVTDEGAIPMVPPKTMQLLLSYNYPGNVRELENIIERAVVLGGDILLPEHLPDSVQHEKNGESSKSNFETSIIIDNDLVFPVNLDEYLGRIERRYIEAALDKSNGIKKKAAELLGINFRSFRYRLHKFNMHDEN